MNQPKHTARILFSLTALLICTISGNFSYAQIQLENFFKNPQQTSYQISPDGSYFSYMAPYENRLNVFVEKVGTKNATRLTSEKDRSISGYFWGNNKTILFQKDFEATKIFIFLLHRLMVSRSKTLHRLIR